ncbi:hemolysin type calcium-binding protein [Aliiruegeria haliotis]|uniref:Hemolysin type calcium-binding protein n=1 Tax=Aliiruegeria haliotis TaxID=1280846 RepID=A0A2T0S084_9RHOB|nr:right-handed parallel beta-helix repeat-containing protein [Aliiruegeria haliotis]PRY26834.1 hemolysin type calcium-binding protein [Aliiruegeria haliotis]
MAILHVYENLSQPGWADGSFTSIQSAIDASQGGDRIVVHAGTYSENLVIRKNDITLVAADGPANTVLKPADRSLDTLEIAGADRVSVSGFRIKGGSDDTKQAVHVHGNDGGRDMATEITLDGNVIERGAGDGLKLSKVADIVVTSNTILGGTGKESGLDMVGGVRVVISGNTFQDIGYVGISLKGGSRDVIVEGNILQDIGHVAVEIGGYTNLPNYIPGFLEAGYTYEIANVLVADNQVSNAGNAAFRVIGGQGVSFQGNSATGTNATVKIDDSGKFHDLWFSDDIAFEGNSFAATPWLIDRSAQADVGDGSVYTFLPWTDGGGGTPQPGPGAIIGTAGGDDIRGTDAPDRVFAGEGDDRVEGRDGDDALAGEGGKDEMDGGRGNDLLFGGDGDDRLFGGQGHDTLDGGAGDDRLRGNDGEDALDGGAGDDRLEGDRGADHLSGQDGADELKGGDGADRLEGGTGDDRLKGEAGADVLVGGTGDDQLEGGDGNDTLAAGSGAGTSKGGDGADTFVFTAADGNAMVELKDFSAREGDRIAIIGFGQDLDTFRDLDSNRDGQLGRHDTGVEVNGDRIIIDLARIAGGAAPEIELRGATLTEEQFVFDI